MYINNINDIHNINRRHILVESVVLRCWCRNWRTPSSCSDCREPGGGHWACVPGQRGQRDGHGGQVSCDWWTRGHVTPCSPLIGHHGQGGSPLLQRHQAQGLQSRMGQGERETSTSHISCLVKCYVSFKEENAPLPLQELGIFFFGLKVLRRIIRLLRIVTNSSESNSFTIVSFFDH